MKILHTSDWHIGARLHDQDRYAEHDAFAAWLLDLLRRERPDAMVVAGDIFDTGAPANRAQAIYFGLLSGIFREALCRTVVVIGGNHDSPSLLDAPGPALAHLQTRVVGEAVPGEPEREVVLVPGADGAPGLAIAAVPYLREGDLRTAEFGESETDRTAKLHHGLRTHYETVAALARQEARKRAGREVPLLLTGHLYVSGAVLSDDRSERSLRIGNLGEMPCGLLPPADYVALGHLHTPQTVGDQEACRYSGSPLPMSFAEARREKSVTLVAFGANAGDPVEVRPLPVPVFQRLEQVRGTPERTRERLAELAVEAGRTPSPSPIWVEVQVTEGEGDLRAFWDDLPRLVEGTNVRILACQNCRPETVAATARGTPPGGLEQMTPRDVFRLRLADEAGMSDADREMLGGLFDEVMKTVQEADSRRE